MTSLDPRNDIGGGEAAAPGEVRRWRAFSLLAVAYFMTAVDLMIVNVALPTIGVKLHFAESDLQWVVTAYALTFGGFLLLGGRAADLLGRRRMFMTGLALFTAASLACALATSGTFLIIMRGVQGLGAAMVLPAALSIVMNMFREGAERNKALGLWGAIGASGATVGVLAGGALTRYAGWPYIFYLNVAVGGAALLLTRRVVPESRLRRRTPPLRPARRHHRDRRPGDAGLRDLAGAGRRVDSRPDPGPARGGGGPAGRVRGHRGQGGGAAAAAAAVPAEDPRRVERGRLPARGQLLRLHLHRHPVHAAGARVLRDEDRPRLAGASADRDGARRAGADARHPRVGQAGDGGRDDPDRRPGSCGRPRCPPTGASGRTSPAPSS